MLNHGINAKKAETNFVEANEIRVGIPFFIGAWPCHTAGGYTGKPQLIRTYAEAVAAGGYSDDWKDASKNPKWTLCEAVFSHFKVFGQSPAVFFNVFDPATNKSAVTAADKSVTDHCVKLPDEAIIDSGLVVKDDDTTLVLGTDYEAAYDGGYLVITLKAGSHYSATTLNIAYNTIDLSGITATTITTAIEKVEGCKSLLGLVPDLICIPGWSQTPAVAAVMATKAASINGMYRAKAVVDLDTSASGADTYEDVATYKTANGYTDENMIVCWPLVTLDSKVFDFSVIMCGLIAQTDAENDGIPSASPSNRDLPIDGCVNKAGAEITLNVDHADVVSYTDGVVTALNFDGWKSWGNYTAVGPTESDVAKKFICTNRMHDFICNVFVDMFWSYLDRPLTRVLIDAIVNEFNSYLTALTASGDLCGGEIAFVDTNNPADDLLAGKFRLDTKMASPVPAQQINMVAEFDVDILVGAFNV